MAPSKSKSIIFHYFNFTTYYFFNVNGWPSLLTINSVANRVMQSGENIIRRSAVKAPCDGHFTVSMVAPLEFMT